MRTKKIIHYMMLPFFASIFMGYSVHLNFRHKNVNSDLLLMNIDAMASKEWGKKFARKYSTTWNEGPFLNSFGQNYIYTYTQVDCDGDGVVDCEFDLNVSIDYL